MNKDYDNGFNDGYREGFKKAVNKLRNFDEKLLDELTTL